MNKRIALLLLAAALIAPQAMVFADDAGQSATPPSTTKHKHHPHKHHKKAKKSSGSETAPATPAQ